MSSIAASARIPEEGFADDAKSCSDNSDDFCLVAEHSSRGCSDALDREDASELEQQLPSDSDSEDVEDEEEEEQQQQQQQLASPSSPVVDRSSDIGADDFQPLPALGEARPSLCSEHLGNELTSYCLECDVLFCAECAPSHEKHPQNEVKAMSAQYIKEATTAMKEARTLRTELQESATYLSNLILDVTESRQAVNAQIRQQTALYRKLLDEREQELMRMLNSSFDGKMRSILEQLNQLESTQAVLDGNLHILQRFVRASRLSPAEAVTLKDSMERAGRDVHDATSRLKAQHSKKQQTCSLSFAAHPALHQEIREAGAVIDRNTIPAKCFMEGIGVDAAILHRSKETAFTITAADVNGLPQRYADEEFKVVIRDPTDKLVPVSVFRIGSATYKATFTPTVAGPHAISVLLHDQHIKGSPFTKVVGFKSFTGTYVTHFGAHGSANGFFGDYSPQGIAVTSEGDVFVCDYGLDRVQIFRVDANACHPKYQFKAKFGSQGMQAGQMKYPWGIAASRNSQIFLCDSGNHRIQVFNSDGTYVTAFGRKGSGDGEFDGVYGIAVSPNDKLFVCDYENRRIQVLSPTGQFLYKFGLNKEGAAFAEENANFKPCSVAVSDQNEVYVCDYGNHTVQIFKSDGTHIRTVGSKGTAPGQLDRPWGVTVAPDGRMFVCDLGNHRVQIFSPEGRFMSQFGSKGSGPGKFIYPVGVALTPDGKVLVADRDNHRVQVFE